MDVYMAKAADAGEEVILTLTLTATVTVSVTVTVTVTHAGDAAGSHSNGKRTYEGTPMNACVRACVHAWVGCRNKRQRASARPTRKEGLFGRGLFGRRRGARGLFVKRLRSPRG